MSLSGLIDGQEQGEICSQIHKDLQLYAALIGNKISIADKNGFYKEIYEFFLFSVKFH